jgi:hypothetical protein
MSTTIDAVLATAAERLAGDPLWLLVVSGPGNAKTETVQSRIARSVPSHGCLAATAFYSPRGLCSKTSNLNTL